LRPLLASPVAWHNYLLLLGPGILLLMARERMALLLLTLQLIPPQWSEPWRGESTVLAALALTFYFYVLVVHWAAFLTYREEAVEDPTTTGTDQGVPREQKPSSPRTEPSPP
jgi:hypothetical protein